MCCFKLWVGKKVGRKVGRTLIKNLLVRIAQQIIKSLGCPGFSCGAL